MPPSRRRHDRGAAPRRQCTRRAALVVAVTAGATRPRRRGVWWRLSPSRLHGKRVHLSLIGLALLLVWISIGAHLREAHEQARQEATSDTSNLARAFEENIVRTFDAIDQTLLFVRELYARDPAHFDLTTWARNRQFLHGATLQISVVDRDGIVVASNLGPVEGRIDLSDRPHIRAQRDSTEDRPFISVPVVGRISSKVSLNVTRKMLDADGAYAGTVIVSVDPGDLSRLQESLGLGNGVMLLVGDDQIVRARAPALPGALGRHLDDAFAGQIAASVGSGTLLSRSPLDGVTRLLSFRRVPNYPLTVAVGLDIDEVYAAYHRERSQYLRVGAVVTLLVLGVGAVLIEQRSNLVRSQAALTATLENITQGILMADADGQVAVINRRAAELLDLPPHLAHGAIEFGDILRWQQGAGEFGPPDKMDPDLRRLVDSGGLTNALAAYERTRPNGRVLEIRSQPLPDGGVVRTYTDITERRATEQALAAARDAAEAAVRARSEFLAVMSHEIRTPMNGILGVAGLLKELALDDTQQAYVRIILDSANHLLDLINDILDFSRLDAGRLDLEDGAFDLHEVVGATVGLLASEALTKQLELSLDIAPDVPHRVGGDARRLRQVLLNLVGNAVKFTEQGSIRVSIVRSADDAGGRVRVRIAVADSGIGIPPEALGKLFTEFTQVDSSISRRFGGSGLGLAISRRLVALMGGTITAESAPGKGSVFRIEMPLNERPDTGEAAAAAAATAAAAARAADRVAAPVRLRVLVAEDNATNRLVATRLLERAGHRVDAVDNGRAAVEAVAAQHYDLVLMDVMMPEMDGLAATAAIRALPGPAARTPILGLTANALRSDAAAGLAAGMDHLVTKPISGERLVQAIREVLSRLRAASPDEADDHGPDHATLAALVREIGGGPAADLVRLFIAAGPRQMAALRDLAARGQQADLLRQVLTLGNAARSLGLRHVVAACDALEQASADPAGGVSAALDRLAQLLDRAVAALRAWQPSPTEPG